MKLKIIGFGKKDGAPFGRDEKGKLIFLGKDNKLKIGDLIECGNLQDHDKVYIADFKKLLPPEGPMKQSPQPQQRTAQEAVACKINGKNNGQSPAPITIGDMYNIDKILDANTKKLVISNPLVRESVKRFIDDVEKGKIQ